MKQITIRIIACRKKNSTVLLFYSGFVAAATAEQYSARLLVLYNIELRNNVLLVLIVWWKSSVSCLWYITQGTEWRWMSAIV